MDGGIIAHSLTKTFNVDRDLAGRFPGVVRQEMLPAERENKVLVRMEEHIPDSFIPLLRPDVIVFLQIIPDNKSNMYPLKQVDVFRRLLKQTVLAAEKDISQKQIIILGKLVRQVRGFELLSGRDIYREPMVLFNLIRETVEQ
jgi:hypothetical protein